MVTSRQKVWLRRIALLGLVGLACQQAWKHGHDYVFADRFVEVEPGKVFRGAWQQAWPMKRIIRDRKIRTIVALAHTPDSALVRREKALANSMGVRWVHIPIVEDQWRSGLRIDDQLEKAAAILADPANQPVYFHCHHGVKRAPMVQIAYRTGECGWTLDRANDEVARTLDSVRPSQGPDYGYMAKFYRDRVLPRRLADQDARPGRVAR